MGQKTGVRTALGGRDSVSSFFEEAWAVADTTLPPHLCRTLAPVRNHRPRDLATFRPGLITAKDDTGAAQVLAETPLVPQPWLSRTCELQTRKSLHSLVML